jgi:hypothetical protein
MIQARPMAWWRQARNDLNLAPPHTHGLPKLVEVLEQQGVDASGLANLPLRALTRMTVPQSPDLLLLPPDGGANPQRDVAGLAEAAVSRPAQRWPAPTLDRPS